MKNIYIILIAVCMSLCSMLTVSTLWAQAITKPIYRYPSYAPIAIDDSVRVGHLANGLTYYIRANKQPEHSAQFRLVVNAGSVQEEDNQQGLARLCERIVFKNAKNSKNGALADLLQQQEVNYDACARAYTSFDETVYYINLPSNTPSTLDIGFKILAEWAHGLCLHNNVVNKERETMLENMAGMDVTERMEMQVWPHMLCGSPYARRMPAGNDTVIRTFHLSALQQYYTNWYRPDMQAIIIVGDIQPAEIEKQIRTYFDTCAAPVNRPERMVCDVPSNTDPVIAVATDPQAIEADVDMYWKHAHTPILTLWDYRDYIVGTLVTGMLHDRLNETGNTLASPYVHAMCHHDSYGGRTTDALELYAQVKASMVSETIIELLKQVYTAVQHGFLASELERQKFELYSRYANNVQEYANTYHNEWAEACTMHFLQQQPMPGAVRAYEYIQQLLPGISLADVNGKIKTWITDSNYVLCVTAPDALRPMLDTNEYKAIYTEVKSVEHSPYSDNYAPRPLMENIPESKTPLSTYIKGYNKNMGCIEMFLNNGVKVLVQPTRYKNDEIQLQAFRYGGTSLCSNEDAFVARHVTGIVQACGLGDFTFTDLQKYLKGKQVSLSPYMEECVSGFSGSCTTDEITTLLQMLYMYFTSPRYDRESMDKYVMELHAQYEYAANDPYIMLADQFRKTCYPYDKRTVILPCEDQWQQFTMEKIADIYSRQFTYADSFTFIFTGNIDSNIIHQIVSYVEQLPVNGAIPMYRNCSTSFAEGKITHTLYKGSQNQSMVIMAGTNTRFSYSPQHELLTRMLGTAMNITMTHEIREKAGIDYTPGVSVYAAAMPQPAVSWQIIAESTPKNMTKTEKLLLKICRQYVQNGPDELTLNKVKEQLINERNNELHTNDFWIDELQKVNLYKINGENYNDYEKQVRAVTVADLQSFALQCLDLNNFVTMKLMPESKGKKREK